MDLYWDLVFGTFVLANQSKMLFWRGNRWVDEIRIDACNRPMVIRTYKRDFRTATKLEFLIRVGKALESSMVESNVSLRQAGSLETSSEKTSYREDY